jgi:alkylation response protein AidB-like acyl-CoA dehydrogenase
MDFAFSDEQEEFRATLRRFFDEKAPPAEVRRASQSAEGYDVDLWKQMGEELGLQGVHVPESCGGQGFGFLELGIVLEEMGRGLTPSPFLPTALATLAIRNAATAAQQEALLPALASGSEIATLAVTEASGRWDAVGISLEAAPDGDEVVLSGEKPFVIDAAAASRLVVAARQPGSSGAQGITLCTLAGDAPGVQVAPVESMDPLRRLGRVELREARAQVLGEAGGAGPALRKTAAQACIALSAEMVGAAQRCLDMAVEYAKVRVQFARPIGSFQAIKHKAADVLLELELARSAAYWACWVADEDGPELEEAAHLAKALCGDALRLASAENIQIHGGIGFTWEHDAHLYYKRSQGSDVLFGDPVEHRAALATHLGL